MLKINRWFLSFLRPANTLTNSASQVPLLRTVMRWPHSIFQPQLSWWPEVKYVYWKDHSPSTVPIKFLYFLLTCSCFNTPDPHHPCSTWPWVTWSFWSRLLFICDLLSIKAAPLLYYTSVLILTKITTILFFQDPYWTQLRGLMKLKDWDYLQAQRISWSLVLPPGWNHRTLTSPPEAPATSQIPYWIPV